MIGTSIRKTNSSPLIEGSSMLYSPTLRCLRSPIASINRSQIAPKRDMSFYQEFRKRINIINRVAKIQIAAERSQRFKQDSIQRKESLKKLKSPDMQHPKKPRLSSNHVFPCKQTIHQERFIYENPIKYRRMLKKTPISLSSYNFDTTIIPVSSSKSPTVQDFQDFRDYLNIKSCL